MARTLRRRQLRRQERVPNLLWSNAVTRNKQCVMCAAFGRPEQRELWPDTMRRDGHHITPQHWLRANGYQAFLWDLRNGLCLCRYHHARHESYIQRIPRRLIPAKAIQFANEVGALWLLERNYPG